MAFIPIPNTARVSIEFNWGGVTVVITLYFNKASAWTDAQLTALAGDINGWVADELLPLMSSDIELISTNATDQSSSSGSSIDVAAAGTPAGEVAQPSIAQNVAAVVTHRTANRGRSYRGRNYIPGLPITAMQTVGTLSAATISALVAAYAALSDVETAEGCTHVVASRFADKAPRTTGVTTPITSYTVDSNSDSQRRRLRGRGT